ncbi:MAG TPA: MOSC domain-containing protein [Ktedonobacteraceae bacterium]|nr:MOSC domain-containing protein [Ktedonobacteraceae bacterium]
MQPASRMQVISVNVGQPREVRWQGQTVMTGIFKEPVAGRVVVGQYNLAGDRQADLTVHGGLERAIYAYPAEYYHFWREQFPEIELLWGMFGENLTIEGLLDDTVHIGDRFQIGSAQMVITQPRIPCYKLGLKFGRDDMPKRFLKSGLTGFHFAVLKEGHVTAGDSITLLHRDEQQVKVADITRLYKEDKYNLDLLRKALTVQALPERWREYFQERLVQLAGSTFSNEG